MNSMTDDERHRLYLDGVANEGRALDARIANIRYQEQGGSLITGNAS